MTEVSAAEEFELMSDFDNALIALGDIQAGIADTAYAAVEEMFTALNEPPEEADE